MCFLSTLKTVSLPPSVHCGVLPSCFAFADLAMLELRVEQSWAGREPP